MPIEISVREDQTIDQKIICLCLTLQIEELQQVICQNSSDLFLKEIGLQYDEDGNKLSTYSLRHTAITFNLSQKGVDELGHYEKGRYFKQND